MPNITRWSALMQFLQWSRYSAIFVAVAIAIVGALADDGSRPANAPSSTRGPVQVSEEALAIHRAALLVDGHNDLPYQFREKADLGFDKLDIRRPQPRIHTDIPRLRKGGVGAQFWSAYVSTKTMKTHTAVRETLEQIDVI